MEKRDVASYGWIKATKWRRLVVLSIDEDELNPTQIVKRIKRYDKCIRLSTLNRIIKELTCGGVIICTDTTMFRGRPYSLTPLGHGFRERLLVDVDYGIEAMKSLESDESPSF